MKGCKTLIVILSIGGGKSVLFMVLALMPVMGTSIVVVPFVALMDDLVARVQCSGIDCIRWTSPAEEQSSGGLGLQVVQMVVVSADVVGFPTFTMYIDSLCKRGLLGQI